MGDRASIHTQALGLWVQCPPHGTVSLYWFILSIFFPTLWSWLAMCDTLKFFSIFLLPLKKNLMMLEALIVSLQILPTLVPVNLSRTRSSYFLFSIDFRTARFRKLSFILSKFLATLKLLLWGTQPPWSWITKVHSPPLPQFLTKPHINLLPGLWSIVTAQQVPQAGRL